MTFPDPNLERPTDPLGHAPGNRQDIVPPTERGQDPARQDLEQGLPREVARPLTHDEKQAAEHDVPPGERVFAPASERVPKPPVPGHRDFVEHPDTHTPERQSSSQTPGAGPAASSPGERTFTRVPRPSVTSTTPDPYASPLSTPGASDDDPSRSGGATSRRRRLFLGIGVSWVSIIAAGVGLVLYLRWRREQNKPINRLRRQARQAVQVASDLRLRMPDADEAARPAMGLGTALLSILLLVWRRTRSRDETQAVRTRQGAARSAQGLSQALSDADWQKRLLKLKERWTPRRLELEKVSISRH